MDRRKVRIIKLLMITLILILILIAPFVMAENYPDDIVDLKSEISTNYQFMTNKYTQMEEDDRLAVNEFITLEGYEYLGENLVSNIGIYVNQEDLSFVIKDLKTDYLWSSKVDNSYLDDEESELFDEEDLNLTPIMKERMKSPIIISYFDRLLKREEGLFDSLGTRYDFEVLSDNKIGFKATIRFAISKIRLTLYVYIDNSGLNVEIPRESIVEGDTIKLSNIAIYEYFGATKNDRIPGYVLIPDGIGALIRFNQKYLRPYNKKFYGNDYGLDQSFLEEQTLMANMYGLVHGIDQNGFIAIVDKGASYANLVSYSSGINDNFNKTFVTFEYRRLYTQFLNKNKTNSIRLLQSDANLFDIKINYQMLRDDEANYLGMANLYREYLNLETKINDSKNISLHLNVLAAENKQTLFGKKTFSMTKVKELEDILKDLNESNINDVNVTYHGWYNKGISNSNLRFNKIIKSVGSKKDFKKLGELNNIYFSIDYTHANLNTRGFSNKDVSQSISHTLINDSNDKLLIKVDNAYKMLEHDMKKLNKLNINNLDFNNLSNELFTDFSKEGLTREEVITYLEMMLMLSDKSAVKNPYSFLWNANLVYDIPMYSSNQTKFTDTVPFIPLVLGSNLLYGRSSNFFSNKTNEMLRMVDYNIYPSFYITNDPSSKLLDTKSDHIYTSRFKDWEDEINEEYSYMNEALKHVINKRVVKREVIDIGLVLNTYSNGVKIYINYSQNQYFDNGNKIDKESYLVIL